MSTSTQSIEIAAPAEEVFAFVSDLERLPRWAIGFAKQIREHDGAWLVTTASGDEVAVRAVSDRGLGVVDYYMSPAPGIEFPAATRVVANGPCAVYVFTMMQPAGMPDEVFAQQVAELGRELVVLKAHLETACPL